MYLFQCERSYMMTLDHLNEVLLSEMRDVATLLAEPICTTRNFKKRLLMFILQVVGS